jgi:riboflavin transporter FmnP
MNRNKKISTNLLVKMSFLSAVGAVLMYFDFPILPAFVWLRIDLSDIPALIGAFAYGPLAGVIIEAMKIFLRFLLKGTQTGGIGEFANFIIGAAYIIPAGLIYRRNKSRKNAIVGLSVATIIMSIVGVAANLYILVPLYASFMESLKDPVYINNYIIYGVLPFNLIKGVLVSAITVLIYKKVATLILRESEVSNSFINSNKKTA